MSGCWKAGGPRLGRRRVAVLGRGSAAPRVGVLLGFQIDRLAVALVDDTFLHDEADTLHQADVLHRVARYRYHVSELAGAEAPEVLVMFEELRGMRGGRLEGEHGRHPCLHHQFELMSILAVR